MSLYLQRRFEAKFAAGGFAEGLYANGVSSVSSSAETSESDCEAISEPSSAHSEALSS